MFKTILSSMATALFTSLLANGFFYWTSQRPTIATVDIVSITSEFIKEESKKNHSNTEKQLTIRTFSHRLEEALQKLSQSNSLVLVPKEAVIKGSPDYTKTLISMMETQS